MAGCVTPQHCLLLCLMVPTVLWAQASAVVTRDPTQPAYAEAAGVSASVPVSRLSSIVTPQKGKPYAVIDGAVTYVGGAIGDALLLQIKEDSVVLKSSTGTETLMLTPGIEKKFTRNATKRSGKAVPPAKDPA